MKLRLLLLATLLMLPSVALGQTYTTIVTATVTDASTPTAVPYAGGTGSATFVPGAGGQQSIIQATGQTFPTQVAIGKLSSSGSFSVTVTSNDSIFPTGSQWQFNICAADGGSCFSATTTIHNAGGTQSVSSTLNAASPVIIFQLTNTPPGPAGETVVVNSPGFSYGAASSGGSTPCTTAALSFQYNNAGAFGCIADWTFATPHTVTLGASAILTLTTGATVNGLTVAMLPTGIPNTNLANPSTTVNGQTCTLGSTCTVTTGTAFPITVSGTVNSGGIPCFNSTTNEQSSAAFTANLFILGGGAGACPGTGSLSDNGTTVSTTEPLAVGASLSTTADGTHPSAVALVGNTTLPSLTTNTVTLLGFPAATNTAWSLQFPTAIPATTDLFSCVVTGTNCLLTDSGIPATATGFNTLIKTLTGCNTATFVYTPQAADCVAPSGGGGSGIPFGPGAGSVNVMTVTTSPAVTSNATGTIVNVLTNLANTTTTPTLNVGGAGAQTILKLGTAGTLVALANGDYGATAGAAYYTFISNGTNWILLNPQVINAASIVSNGGITSVNAGFALGATQGVQWNGRSGIFVPADGQAQFFNNAATGFTRLLFGPSGTTMSGLGVNGPIMSSQHADGSAGGMFLNGGTNRVGASGFTTAASTALQTITGLSWTVPATGTITFSYSCDLVYSQATGSAAVAFGIQAATANPTNIFSTGTEQITVGPPGTYVSGTLATLATTTATNIVSGTPTALATNYTVHLAGTIENPATTANTFNIMVSTATSADAVTILRGSQCTVY